MEDLLALARLEAKGSGLFQALSERFEPANVCIDDNPEAVLWQKYVKGARSVRPIAHALTDKFALIGTLAAIDVLQLPCYAVPMWAQYRHDTELAPLQWFGALPFTSIKWSTAGDTMVFDKALGKQVVVSGKSGNAVLRTAAGVYCNVRSYGPITVVRAMPCLPYSQDKSRFYVDSGSGMVHSEMNTPGVQMAYANRLFFKIVHEQQAYGRYATKPTQAMEDGVNAGLHSWMLAKTQCSLERRYAVDPYGEHKQAVDAITALLPDDFYQGLESCKGKISQHIADTSYGLLLWDLVERRKTVVFATDIDGDRLTDLLADCSDVLRAFGKRVLDYAGNAQSVETVWGRLGYTTGNGRDMTSKMYRLHGPPIYEQTLGSADAMLERLLAGDERMGGAKQPYDPTIHYTLMRDAYLAANPGNKRLADWFSEVMAVLESVYAVGGNRPGFIEGCAELKRRITPWSK